MWIAAVEGIRACVLDFDPFYTDKEKGVQLFFPKAVLFLI